MSGPEALALQRVRTPEVHVVRGTIEYAIQTRVRPRNLPVCRVPIIHVQYVRHAEATRCFPKGDAEIEGHEGMALRGVREPEVHAMKGPEIGLRIDAH